MSRAEKDRKDDALAMLDAARKGEIDMAALALEQAKEFTPDLMCMEDEAAALSIKGLLPKGVELYAGKDAAAVAARYAAADTVVNAVSGFAGTLPLIAALEAGKKVALANKESIVCAHELVEQAKRKGGGEIIPVDSEQSAIFQCLCAGEKREVRRLILTASGGPFRQFTKEQLAEMQEFCRKKFDAYRALYDVANRVSN